MGKIEFSFYPAISQICAISKANIFQKMETFGMVENFGTAFQFTHIFIQQLTFFFIARKKKQKNWVMEITNHMFYVLFFQVML